MHDVRNRLIPTTEQLAHVCWYLAAGHAMHSVIPPPGEYLPQGHVEQEAAVATYRPGPHPPPLLCVSTPTQCGSERCVFKTVAHV